MIFEDFFEEYFDYPAHKGYTEYPMGGLIELFRKWTYSADVRLIAHPQVYYRMSCRMDIPSPFYLMDAIIVLSDVDPRLSESWINAALWSYANEIRKLNTVIDNAVLRLKIEYASSDDLDDHWGKVLALRRKYGETDESFRSRLITHISIITTSGITSKIEDVINSIVGIKNAARIETFYPAEIVLAWNSHEVVQIASEKSLLITEAMNRMIASGILWSVSYPYATYWMDLYHMIHPESSSYYMDGAITKRRGKTYHMVVGIWDSNGTEYHMEALLYGYNSKTYKAKLSMVAEPSVNYLMGGKIL